MTRPDVPTPPPTDAEYVRKLALAILSTLQNKGLLSPAEVDSILIAARRAAQESAARGGRTPTQEQTPPAEPLQQVAAQPSPEQPKEDAKPEGDEGERQPPVIDFKLD
ncbi:hypothetical protein [Deinococcus apachensis]|uniref:hypothetical protein n=1 Tax=Deinococcus apachensis TaxID=309886 RepID=UPI00037C0724|nr:hypothetical protein [Deinococcus apachensis]